MEQLVTSEFKLGIIAGGQLGKMLVLAASNWDVKTYILDPVERCPSATHCTDFTLGDYNDFETVLNFGRKVDMITFEIENVNVEALRQLKKEGIRVHPDPEVMATIQDKGLQKLLYREKEIPTADFTLFADEVGVKTAVESGELTFPFVQKSRKEGYDGKGVAVIKSKEELKNLLQGPCVIETAVDIHKEIAVIVARNTKGEIACFPPVEMEFNHDANLVEQLICPASIDEKTEKQAIDLARQVIENFEFTGILAVEMFIDSSGAILINEVAPRPHNSGHHTIESAITSQYEQHLRAIFGFPLGSTQLKLPSVMINLLGQPNHTGPVKYEGLTESMQIEGVKIHIYGKKETKPFRKMGHVTVLSTSLEKAKENAHKVKEQLKVKAW